MALDGIILDLEGALLFTRAARVQASARGFERCGYSVSHDRISVELSRDPATLVLSVLGRDVEKHQGTALRSACSEEYARIVAQEGLTVAPGAEALLRELHRRGIETAIVTSASDEELALTEKASGIAWRKIVDVAADTLATALTRLGMMAAQCALLADSRSDARAARQMGLVTIGIASAADEGPPLLRSGARLVYRDPADLVSHLDHALRRASPGAGRFDRAMLERLVREALAVAEDNLQKCRAPTGAVVAGGDGTVIARGRDLTETHGRLAHAELEALRAASPLLTREAGLVLVSTREPCAMCTAAAVECGVDTIIYARRESRSGGSRRLLSGGGPRHELPRIVGGVLAEESELLHTRFLRSLKPPTQFSASAGRAGIAARAR
jgi:tRNA(Arg) A34 adenosine deaminase TadA/phosphoglycolate phosphatase-like HAD superfamily hydrolase